MTPGEELPAPEGLSVDVMRPEEVVGDMESRDEHAPRPMMKTVTKIATNRRGDVVTLIRRARSLTTAPGRAKDAGRLVVCESDPGKSFD